MLVHYKLYPHKIPVYPGKATGMMQVCKEQNGDMVLNLNGEDNCYSEFVLFCLLCMIE